MRGATKNRNKSITCATQGGGGLSLYFSISPRPWAGLWEDGGIAPYIASQVRLLAWSIMFKHQMEIEFPRLRVELEGDLDEEALIEAREACSHTGHGAPVVHTAEPNAVTTVIHPPEAPIRRAYVQNLHYTKIRFRLCPDCGWFSLRGDYGHYDEIADLAAQVEALKAEQIRLMSENAALRNVQRPA